MKKYLLLTIIIVAIVIPTCFLLDNIPVINKSIECDQIVEGETIIPTDNNIVTNKRIESDHVIESKTIIPTLMYHHFVEVGEKTSYTTITNKAFEEQITYLKSKGYNTVTDQDIVDFYYNGKELPQNPIHITIDDGYESNYKFAYPILKKNNMKATIFIIVSRIDGEYGPPRLTWEQIKEMSDSGVISIQSHTYDLHHKENINLVEESAMIAYDSSEYHRKIVDDLIISKRLIEYKLGNEVISMSYPYGHYNEKNLSDVEEAGFKIAYTVDHGLNKFDTSPLELYRINVTPNFTGKTIEKEIIKQKELLNFKTK